MPKWPWSKPTPKNFQDFIKINKCFPLHDSEKRYGIWIDQAKKMIGKKIILDHLYGLRNGALTNMSVITTSDIYGHNSFTLTSSSLEFLKNAKQGNMFIGLGNRATGKIYLHPTYPRSNQEDQTTLYQGPYPPDALFKKPLSTFVSIDDSRPFCGGGIPIHDYFRTYLIKQLKTKSPSATLEHNWFGFSVLMNDPHHKNVIKTTDAFGQQVPKSSFITISASINGDINAYFTSPILQDTIGNRYISVGNQEFIEAMQLQWPPVPEVFNHSKVFALSSKGIDFLPQNFAKHIALEILKDLNAHGITKFNGILNLFQSDMYIPR